MNLVERIKPMLYISIAQEKKLKLSQNKGATNVLKISSAGMFQINGLQEFRIKSATFMVNLYTVQMSKYHRGRPLYSSRQSA